MQVLIIHRISLAEIMHVDARPAPEKPQSTYQSLPKQFVGPDSWPKYTNLLCWTCSRVPYGYPRFLPKNARQSQGRDICEPEGNFCGWPCVGRYIMTEYPRSQVWDLLQTTLIFARLFEDSRDLREIPIAPRKDIMKPYKGDDGITEEEFQAKIDKLLAAAARAYVSEMKN